MMRQISSLINVRWFLGMFPHSILLRRLIVSALTGIPFMDASNFHLGIAEQGQAILGDYLIGLQVGNEPDLYARHKRRPAVSQTISYPLTLHQLRERS
jgi:hypothetical protein